LFIIDHNFWTRNVRKLIKVSEDADCSLDSNENFIEILLSSGWAQVRWQQPKMAKNLPYVRRHSQKNKTQNQNFFYCSLEDLLSLLRVWTAF